MRTYTCTYEINTQLSLSLSLLPYTHRQSSTQRAYPRHIYICTYYVAHTQESSRHSQEGRAPSKLLACISRTVYSSIHRHL